MTNYFVDVPDDLAERLQRVDSEIIVEALENVADEHGPDSDELAQYDSVKQIRSDESISPEERKRRELRWQRVVGRRYR